MQHKRLTFSFTFVLSLLLIFTFVGSALGQDTRPSEPQVLQSKIKTYTLNADFDEGTLVNLNHTVVSDQLQLDSVATPFEFIWVAASGRGTIIKIDTVTGSILGEYWSAPDGRGRDPSRTTVDGNGNVWAGDRAEVGQDGRGAIVHIGLEENGQCVDRNGNGVIDTSTGLGDIRPWSNTGGADNNGGVTTAEDECIIHYVRTTGTGMRTLAVDQNNDVWAGGAFNTTHEKIDGTTGTIIPGTGFNLGCGGYGGLIDANGILWSASYPYGSHLLRYDTNTSTGVCLEMGRTTYGLGIDTNGNIWLSNYDVDTVQKISPIGTILGTFTTFGANGDRGVAVTAADNNVWVANSFGNNISRLDNNGVFKNIVTVGTTPTGVAVDAAGKVWVTNLATNNAVRIDPTTNLVDLTVDLGPGAGPYNYSDMTGSTLIAPPNFGTWTVVYNSQITDAMWRDISWNSLEPGDSTIIVKVASSPDGVTFGPELQVSNGSNPSADGITGQYLKVIVSFNRGTSIDSPILYDLTISTNQPPVADPNGPYVFPLEADGFDGSGSFDPDGDSLTFDWVWGDSSSSLNAGPNPAHTYAAAGIYDVCLTVNDGYVDSEQVCTMAVIYDPSAGFVTGGGWIYSSPGSYFLDPLLEGRANFGFVSKYQKGAFVPTGSTEFQFQVGGLNFHSTNYSWLVITGGNYARFKGIGTINGEGTYHFMIWAGDGTGKDGADTFRIKIWTLDENGLETVIYDNGMNQDISGGSIVVHTKQ